MFTSVRPCYAIAKRERLRLYFRATEGRFKTALRSLEMNPDLASKIVLRNRALGDDSKIEFLQL